MIYVYHYKNPTDFVCMSYFKLPRKSGPKRRHIKSYNSESCVVMLLYKKMLMLDIFPLLIPFYFIVVDDETSFRRKEKDVKWK